MVVGQVEAGFGSVADAFHRNFRDHRDVGAAVAVFHEGRLVVDLAGGRDPFRYRAFTRETLMRVASCSKGAVAICLAMLMGDGTVDPDERVATYWPGFAQAGKDDITVRMVLAHQAGLPYPDPGSGLTGLDQLAGPRLVRQLERQRPWWEPGSAFAYHPITYGALLGEVVHRVTGQTLGRWFATHVADPLGLKFWFGLPAALDDLVAPSLSETEDDGSVELAHDGPPSDAFASRRMAAMAELPPMDPDSADPLERRAYYGLEGPAAHGITNARSLARMYAATIGEVDGMRLLQPEFLQLAVTPQTDYIPALIESNSEGGGMRFGLGFQLPSPSMPGLTPASFGHAGAGGRLGIADPRLRVALGYVCNRMSTTGVGGDPRWRVLLEAIGDCV